MPAIDSKAMCTHTRRHEALPEFAYKGDMFCPDCLGFFHSQTAPMPDAEVLAKAAAFDPMQPPVKWTNERLYRLALQGIVAGKDAEEMRELARVMLAAVDAREAA